MPVEAEYLSQWDELIVVRSPSVLEFCRLANLTIGLATRVRGKHASYAIALKSDIHPHQRHVRLHGLSRLEPL